MGFVKEFKEFALKGNVIDLAIAVVIGAAFGAIVTSLVQDVITPLILRPALEAARISNLEELAWRGVKYGKFLAAIITFLVIALVLFGLIQAINRLKRNKESAAVTPSKELTLTEKLLTEIRDGLRK